MQGYTGYGDMYYMRGCEVKCGQTNFKKIFHSEKHIEFSSWPETQFLQ